MAQPARLLVLGLTFLGTAHLSLAEDTLFESKVRPLLVTTCFKCHGGERTAGGLRVDSREALLKGGESGPSLLPGDPERSLLVRAVRHAEGVKPMPPGKTLPSDIVTALTAWIRSGAPWPAVRSGTGFTTRRHWAFEPIRAISPPESAESHPVDRFLSIRLRERGLTPKERADRRTLLRRATLDLTGLPPTPEEMSAFLADPAPDAFVRVVDRLLASPRYGERWGRIWLDVVRYADTAGETADFPVPDAWRYRNYVINAFNRDMPYDVFLREQLAGDLLAANLPPEAPTERRSELTIATGFVSIARRFGFDILDDHYLTIDDTLDTLGKSVLGLALGCARCHDHKYDPLTTHDYYALYGIFESTRYPFPGCEKTKTPRDLVALVRGGTTGPMAYAVAEGQAHDAQVQKRGDPKVRGESVPRRFVQILGGQTLPPNAGSGRLHLAEWITDPKNPLTPRVLVNRVWQHHFGQGLVKTPNDFGTRGEPPTHPELLDWLTGRFLASGWSLKSLHRLLMTSNAYQRSSGLSPSTDSDNSLLSHFSRRRLSAEEIRDAMLAVSGDLDGAQGGAHPFPEAKSWGFTQHGPFSAVYDHNRRSVYLMTQRLKRHPFLALFDGADTNSSTAVRHATTVPTQALYFLNDPFVHARSASLARRLRNWPEDAARLEHASQLLYGRPALPSEKVILAQFLSEYSTAAQDMKEEARLPAAWSAWLRAMFSSNEFLHVE